jgi:membrane associated rhomboid family serine protease
MAFSDRRYLRVGPGSGSGLGRLGALSVNTWIIIINVVVFLLDPMLGSFRQEVVVERKFDAHPTTTQIVVPTTPRPLPPVNSTYQQPLFDGATRQKIGDQTIQVMPPLQAFGHFSTAKAFVDFTAGGTIFGLEVWRFVTFQFLHANLMHVVMNMFGMWVFGGMVEQQLGRRRYLAFYLACGVAGAITYLILNFVGSQFTWSAKWLPVLLRGDPHTALIGASAGVFGVIIACAKIAPNEMVQLMFPPVPLKLKYLAYGYFAIAAGNLLWGGSNAGGDAAHVGGAIAGFFLIRNSHVLHEFLDVFGPGRSPAKGNDPSERAEVDRILDKVANKGLASLNARERKTLQRASDRERRRAGEPPLGS